MRHRLNGIVTSNDNAELYRLFGYQDVCCPNDVRSALEQTPEGEEITFEINSGGGSVYEGFEMHNLIRNSGWKTTAEIYGLAASAASVISAACGTVRMSPVSNMMIHRSAIAHSGGNAERLEQDARMLHAIDESILNAYESKSGGKASRSRLRHMMENETFLTPQEAVECGLADEIMQEEADPMQAVAAVSTAGIGLPAIEDLRKLYHESRRGIQTDMEEEKIVEINTMEELLTAAPAELIAQLRSEAAAQERQRIADIQDVTPAGFEELAHRAIADPDQSAATVAMEIARAVKAQGAAALRDIQQDAQDSGVNGVCGTPEPEAEDSMNAQIEADLKRWKERN